MYELERKIVLQTEDVLRYRYSETLQETTPQRLHECLGEAVMRAISESWIATQQKQLDQRQAFYFSAEYLVGRLVYNNLFNMGLLHEVRSAFAEKGVDLSCMEEIEDAALGNGGLGRLA
ncbi:MAG: glycogen phosphorylase, partial [Eubacteriales bacterium]|nr:glycogen phosphorylase [Eubacteriales bacterium]